MRPQHPRLFLSLQEYLDGSLVFKGMVVAEIFKNTTEQEGKMKKSFSFSFFYPPFMSHFTLRQREMLSEFLSVGKSYRMIGKAIGKSISSISDEIKRNS